MGRVGQPGPRRGGRRRSPGPVGATLPEWRTPSSPRLPSAGRLWSVTSRLAVRGAPRDRPGVERDGATSEPGRHGESRTSASTASRACLSARRAGRRGRSGDRIRMTSFLTVLDCAASVAPGDRPERKAQPNDPGRRGCMNRHPPRIIAQPPRGWLAGAAWWFRKGAYSFSARIATMPTSSRAPTGFSTWYWKPARSTLARCSGPVKAVRAAAGVAPPRSAGSARTWPISQ